MNGTTTVYIGGYFEYSEDNGVSAGTRKVYSLGSQRVAVQANHDPVKFLFSDHLGSTLLMLDSVTTSETRDEVRYQPFGELRYQQVSNGTSLPTDLLYTGQRRVAEVGLYYYNARWVDVQTGHFTQPDTVTKDGFDHFGYGKNNPINFNDPTGHDVGCTGYDASRCEGSYNNLQKQLEKRQYTVTPIIEFIYNEMMTNAKGEYVQTLRDLNSDGGLFSETVALGMWADKVAPDHKWDHKPQIIEREVEAGRDPDYQQAGTRAYHFDTWSNIHYGFVGMAAGFTQDTLLDGAGAAQALDDFFDPYEDPVADPSANGLRKYDPPEDRLTEQIGIDLWVQYGFELQPEDIIWAIEHSNGIPTRP